MGSPHDGQYHHLSSVDPTQAALRSPDPQVSFSSVVGSSHPDVPLPSASHPVPSLFPDELNSASSLTVPMDLSHSSAPTRMDISPVDILNSAAARDHAQSAGSMSAFQNTLHDSYSGESISDMPLQPSPPTTSGSSYASHTSSPAIPGMNPGYGVTPSSIASALDSMGLPGRSRSGSSASPGIYVGSSTDLGFPSTNSGPPTSSHSSGYTFPPSDFTSTPPTDDGGSPDISGGPHLMAVGDMLKKVTQIADSARHDCNLGQGANAESKIDQLKRTIALVAELIAATRLADGPSPPGGGSVSPPLGSATTRASPPHLARPGPGVQPLGHLNGSAGVDPQSLDGSGSVDHESRKRCASSMGEDRVMKAMKLEPQDELTLIPPSQPSFPFPPTTSGIPSSKGINPIPPFPSNPSSAPSSRPASSAGMSLHHQLNLYQPTQLPSHLPMNYPPPLTLASSVPRSALDLTPPASATHPPSASAHMATYGHAPDPWSDRSYPHPHTLSGNILAADVDMQNIVMGGAPSYAPVSSYSSASSVTPLIATGAAVAPQLHHDVTRMSRSNSLSNQQADPFAFGLPDSAPAVDERIDYRQSRPGTAFSRDRSPASSVDYDGDDHDSDAGEHSHSPPSRGPAYRGRVGSVDQGSGHPPSAYSRPSTGHRRSLASHPSTDNFAAASSAGHGNEVPHEYRAEVDRIFFEFLTKICSNLDATDAKGEPIHQTLMAKKMQRLDESPDFRPFKFRIQAFTNAFLEELARQGYPEDKIPMKKIRNYLWNSTYISRFNEDGKKAKSKGNHIWNIEAKKATAEGGWIFRPFHRRLAGLPAAVAYIGLRWSWTPRVWDPQASRNNLPVTYTSPSLPPWLSWQDDTLSGIPPPDALDCDVTVEARFVQDGVEEFLTQTVHVGIAPMSNVDNNFGTPSRRPSLVGEGARRIASDSVVPQSTPARVAPILRAQTALAAPPPAPPPVASQDAQLIQVLTTAAQRVAQEAQSQVVAAGAPSEPGHELQALAKQQHVLTVTAQAVDETVSAQGSSVSQPSSVLAQAAQQVVLQAARSVAADRSAQVAAQISRGLPQTQASTSQVTVNEVSVATQTAVAQAVEIAGPLSSEVDVLMTASSLLQQQQQSSRVPVAPAPVPSAMDALRSLPSGSLLTRTGFNGLPPGVPGLPDAGMLSTGLPIPISSVDLGGYAQRS